MALADPSIATLTNETRLGATPATVYSELIFGAIPTTVSSGLILFIGNYLYTFRKKIISLKGFPKSSSSIIKTYVYTMTCFK